MRTTTMKRLFIPLLVLPPAAALADGVAQILTAKSIPASTIAVIDPESGTSEGGAGTDVKYAVGDILSFRFRYFPVPDNNGSLDGMQGYLTEFIPPNTQVVGVRILSGDSSSAVVIPPRYPGMSVDNGGTTNGSISEVYADTGIFNTGDNRLVRSPVADFLLLNNGIPITEPTQASNIAAIVGANPG